MLSRLVYTPARDADGKLVKAPLTGPTDKVVKKERLSIMDLVLGKGLLQPVGATPTLATGKSQAAEAQQPGVISRAAASAAEPAKKKQKTAGTYSVGASQQMLEQLAAQQMLEKHKDAAMARALYNAAETHGGKSVTLSQLGADYNVSQLKKDTQFKNHKLIDILRYHENVFELVPDSAIGGFVVSLHTGARSALPDADTFVDDRDESELLLPERLEDPRSQGQRMQALRIELCHVLHKRGGKVALYEVGQDQKVQKVKTALPKTLKLVEFIRLFPGNFSISTGAGGLMDITLDSADVSDQSMIERKIQRAHDATQKFKDSKGERAIADVKEKLQETIKEGAELITKAAEAVSNAEKQAISLSSKGKELKSTEMVALADETDGIVEETKKSVKQATDAVAAADTETLPELKAFLVSEVKKLEALLKPFEGKIAAVSTAASKFRADASKKDFEENQQLRAKALAMIFHHQGVKKMDPVGLFEEFDKKNTDKIGEPEFAKFFEVCEKKDEESKLSEDEISRLFAYLDSDQKGFLTKEFFLNSVLTEEYCAS